MNPDLLCVLAVYTTPLLCAALCVRGNAPPVPLLRFVKEAGAEVGAGERRSEVRVEVEQAIERARVVVATDIGRVQ